MRHFVASVISFLALLSAPCEAQVSDLCKESIVDPTVERVVKRMADAREESIKAARTDLRARLADATTILACIGALEKKFAGVLERRRIDKQVGAASGAAGSTSLVPGGSVPALIGLAVEYGGLTQSFNGTTVTFRTTPAKLIAALGNAYGPNAAPTNDNTLAVLQRVSLSVSFDTSRTDQADTTGGSQLRADYQQLSQASARVVLINDRDPLAPKNWQKIRDLSKKAPSRQVANLGRDLMEPLFEMDGFRAAVDETMDVFDKLNKAEPDKVVLTGALTRYVEEIQKLTISVPNWQERVDAYGRARIELDEEHKRVYREISKAPSLTLEYDFNRPPVVSATAASAATPGPVVTAPDLSSVRLIYVASLMESEYTVTASANFFNQTRPGMDGSFRDFQVAAKWDVAVGRLPAFIAKGVLTFSGLYERLHQKPMGIDLLINDEKVNQPGNIAVFQAKYSIPVGDSGVSIPISFTASNRTELIKERNTRGNIGITFDLDKLLTPR
jgi:hypothetical protein